MKRAAKLSALATTTVMFVFDALPVIAGSDAGQTTTTTVTSTRTTLSGVSKEELELAAHLEMLRDLDLLQDWDMITLLPALEEDDQ